jgi:hypothetical protein
MSTAIRQVSWALAAPPRPRIEPVLGLRALRYVAEGHPGQMPPVPGLRVTAAGLPGAVAEWDGMTGESVFGALPPGPRRILVTDPERRYLPAALEVVVPSRLPVRPTAPQQSAAGDPLHLTLRLRPAPGRALPPDVTAVIGTVRDAAGRAIALARIACTTVSDGRETEAVTWSAADGAFVLPLPGEDAGRTPVARALALHLPSPELARALAADFLGALPADLDRAPAEAGGLFRAARYTLADAAGAAPDAPAGVVPLRLRRSIRWDIVAA